MYVSDVLSLRFIWTTSATATIGADEVTTYSICGGHLYDDNMRLGDKGGWITLVSVHVGA